MHKNWTPILEGFWKSEYVPDEFSVNDVIVVKSFIAFLDTRNLTMRAAVPGGCGTFCDCGNEAHYILGNMCERCGLPPRPTSTPQGG